MEGIRKMSDYIKREEAIMAVGGPVVVTGIENAEVVASAMRGQVAKLKNIPAADVAPIRHGHWIRQSARGYFVKCSECGGKGVIETDYCPDCGAEMDG